MIRSSLLCIVLAAGCASGARSHRSADPLEWVVSLGTRDWRELTVDALQESGPRFARVDNRNGCNGAVFLQSIANGPAAGELTLTLEVDSEPTPGARGACLEHLTTVTVSLRADRAVTAVQFATMLAERLELGLGSDADVIEKALAKDGAYAWNVATAADGKLRRRDLEVRREHGRWLAQYREFRDDMPR